MRACLLALLMLFCLPLQWAGAATGVPVNESCAPIHTSLTAGVQQAAADDTIGEVLSQHSHCGSCHTGALAMPASVSFGLNDATSGLLPVPTHWSEVMLIERPERPQWLTLV